MTETEATAFKRKTPLWIGLLVFIGAAAAVAVMLLTQHSDQAAAPTGKKPTADEVTALVGDLSSGDPTRISTAIAATDSSAISADMVSQLTATPVELDYSTLQSIGSDSVQIKGSFNGQDWLFYLTLSGGSWVVVATVPA